MRQRAAGRGGGSEAGEWLTTSNTSGSKWASETAASGSGAPTTWRTASPEMPGATLPVPGQGAVAAMDRAVTNPVASGGDCRKESMGMAVGRELPRARAGAILDSSLEGEPRPMSKVNINLVTVGHRNGNVITKEGLGTNASAYDSPPKMSSKFQSV